MDHQGPSYIDKDAMVPGSMIVPSSPDPTRQAKEKGPHGALQKNLFYRSDRKGCAASAG